MSYINKKKTNTKEKGIALITVMLMMAVMTVLSITMFNTSTVENLISSNYRTSKEAFFDAEAGVQYALARIETDLNSKTINTNNLNDPNGFDLGYFDLSSLRSQGYNFEYPELLFTSGASYCFTSLGKDPDNAGARSEIETCFTIETKTHPVFGMGIASEGSITIRGTQMIEGNIHSNSSVNQSGQGQGTIDGNVSAHHEVNISAVVTGDKIPGAEYMDIPEISGELFDELRNEASLVLNEGYAEQTVTLENRDLQDKVVFVYGNVEIDSDTTDIANTTIIATGNVTVDGESSWGGEANTIISGNNIEFNGSGERHGVFWCNGSFSQNGSSTITGSIVASGDVDTPTTFSGNFNFSLSENIPVRFLPEIEYTRLESWTDQSLIL